MGKVVKGIGKAISAPVRGIGHAFKTSGIPIVSGLGGSAEKFGNAFAGKGGFLKNLVGGGVPLAATALGGAGLLGSGPLAGIASKIGGSGIMKSIGGVGKSLAGQAIGAFKRPDGSPDLGKIIAGAGGLSNMIGANQQRKSAQNYANAQVQRRNRLSEMILQQPDYGSIQDTPGY